MALHIICTPMLLLVYQASCAFVRIQIPILGFFALPCRDDSWIFTAFLNYERRRYSGEGSLVVPLFKARVMLRNRSQSVTTLVQVQPSNAEHPLRHSRNYKPRNMLIFSHVIYTQKEQPIPLSIQRD
jgi:hypothetical protein